MGNWVCLKLNLAYLFAQIKWNRFEKPSNLYQPNDDVKKKTDNRSYITLHAGPISSIPTEEPLTTNFTTSPPDVNSPSPNTTSTSSTTSSTPTILMLPYIIAGAVGLLVIFAAILLGAIGVCVCLHRRNVKLNTIIKNKDQLVQYKEASKCSSIALIITSSMYGNISRDVQKRVE